MSAHARTDASGGLSRGAQASSHISEIMFHNFASSVKDRKYLGDKVWGSVEESIPVVRQFKYLGAHISTTQGMNRSVMDSRFALAAGMARRLSRLPLSTRAKAHAIVAKVLPLALYGVEVANPTEAKLKHLTTTIIECFAGKGTKADLDLVFSDNC